ncbi:MAG: hypothetical protein EOO75_04975 [Myxococcales bacterium]|nr:MAG: hypothetical protein EOO75_04975 [Myxococcales bacterium]
MLLAVSVALTPTPARAQTDTERAAASQMADEGAEAYQKGEWARALRQFQRAYAIVPAPSFLLYQARCHDRLGQLDEADNIYQRTIENGDGDKSATAQQAANEARGEQRSLRQRRDALRARAAAPATTAPASSSDSGGPSGLRTASWAAFGVGATGLLVGLVSGGVMLSKKSTLDDECVANRCGPAQEGDLSGFRSARTVSWVGWSVGLAGAATGLTLWLIDRKPSDGPKTTARLVVGPSFSGVQGAFLRDAGVPGAANPRSFRPSPA